MELITQWTLRNKQQVLALVGTKHAEELAALTYGNVRKFMACSCFRWLWGQFSKGEASCSACRLSSCPEGLSGVHPPLPEYKLDIYIPAQLGQIPTTMLFVALRNEAHA